MHPRTFARARTHAGRLAAASALLVAASVVFAPPASALRIMNHNLLNWSAATAAARVGFNQAIVRGIAPDLVVCQEVVDTTAVNIYRTQVLGLREPGEWSSAPFTDGPDTDNMLFYRTSKFDLLDVVQVPTALRNATRYHLRLDGYTGAAAEFYVYSFHLKASSGSTNEQLRYAEMQLIRANAETLPIGSHIFFCGDYNVYTGSEPAFQYALSSIGDNVGRMKDPINKVGAWSSNTSYALYHTQSPRNTQFGGGANGGMDDRFDFILESYNWDDGQGLELLESTYTAYGNDGLHCCNQALDGPLASNPTGPPQNLAVGVAQADSIRQASDHLPVFADLSVPARLDLPFLAHDFGTVIEGAVATWDLPIGNVADIPGDGLDYSFDTAAFFAAPAGPLTLAPGAATTHPVAMITTPPGPRAEALGIFTDAPGNEYVPVALSGLVLAHASSSSDSAIVTLADTLDFGTQEAGGFSDRTARVWNPGWDAQRAALHVAGAAIVGGAGRFVLVEPFAAQLVTDGAAAFDVAFDDVDASAESTYTATLTFTSGDDPQFAGAIARPDVVYTLLARVANPIVDAGGADAAPPTRTLLFAPSPNPVTGASLALRFDLAAAGRVRLDLYDVRGRHVASLVDGERPAGRHAVRWDGREANGRPAGNGVYFAQMRVADGTVSDRRFVLMR